MTGFDEKRGGRFGGFAVDVVDVFVCQKADMVFLTVNDKLGFERFKVEFAV